MKRWTPWLLLLVLLGAQTVQAWHAPAHIHDFEAGSLFSFDHEACPFGVNGHGAASTAEFRLEIPLAADCGNSGALPAFTPVRAALVPPARAPPSSRH